MTDAANDIPKRETPDLARAAVLGYPVDIPGEHDARIAPMPYKDAVRWNRELDVAIRNGYGGLFDTMDEFAAEVELTDGRKLEDLPLNFIELFAVARDFLLRVRDPFRPLIADLLVDPAEA